MYIKIHIYLHKYSHIHIAVIYASLGIYFIYIYSCVYAVGALWHSLVPVLSIRWRRWCKYTHIVSYAHVNTYILYVCIIIYVSMRTGIYVYVVYIYVSVYTTYIYTAHIHIYITYIYIYIYEILVLLIVRHWQAILLPVLWPRQYTMRWKQGLASVGHGLRHCSPHMLIVRTPSPSHTYPLTVITVQIIPNNSE